MERTFARSYSVSRSSPELQQDFERQTLGGYLLAPISATGTLRRSLWCARLKGRMAHPLLRKGFWERSREKLYNPHPPFLAKRHFPGEGGGCVYFEAPRGRNFIPPPPLLHNPPPRRVFSGVGGVGVYKIWPRKRGFSQGNLNGGLANGGLAQKAPIWPKSP